MNKNYRSAVSVMTGLELRAMIAGMGLHQQQFAELIGFSHNAVYRWVSEIAPIPLVVERAVCFLALKVRLLEAGIWPLGPKTFAPLDTSAMEEFRSFEDAKREWTDADRARHVKGPRPLRVVE